MSNTYIVVITTDAHPSIATYIHLHMAGLTAVEATATSVLDATLKKHPYAAVCVEDAVSWIPPLILMSKVHSHLPTAPVICFARTRLSDLLHSLIDVTTRERLQTA